MALRGRCYLRRDNRRATSRDLRRQTLNDYVEDGRQEESEQRDTEHAGENGDAHGLTHFGARARRQHERNDAHDESDRRHEHGAQADSASLENRLSARSALGLSLASELDD